MPSLAKLVQLAPPPLRPVLLRHREIVKFLAVGGTCFLITTVVNYALKLTVLTEKPVTALTIATVFSTVVSYILNREWSFRTRGGRERHHEAALFFLVSGFGVVVNDIPLYAARYVFELRVPVVSRPVQEVSDFISGIILGTLLAMVFRLWAFKKWVFPHAEARSPLTAEAASLVAPGHRFGGDSTRAVNRSGRILARRQSRQARRGAGGSARHVTDITEDGPTGEPP